MTEFASEDEICTIFKSKLEGDGAYEFQSAHVEDEGGEKLPLFILKHPWNDPTLVLAVPAKAEEAQGLATVLDRVELPEKYSGIFHKQSEELEIW